MTSIWEDKEVCKEAKLVKRPWYIRNGQDLAPGAGFAQPVVYLVIQKDKKKVVQYGPVVEVGYSKYTRGKEEKVALLMLCLGEKNMTSVVVDDDEFDTTACVNYIPDDLITSDICNIIETKGCVPWYTWFTEFLKRCQVTLYPMILTAYSEAKGAPWKKPIKLLVKSPTGLSIGSKSSSGGDASGSGVGSRAAGSGATGSRGVTGKRSRRGKAPPVESPRRDLTVDDLEKDDLPGDKQLVPAQPRPSTSEGRSRSSGAPVPEVIVTFFFKTHKH
jgi:hypothetical protein